MWAAEPKLDERKHLGFQVMIFLFVFTGLLYFTKKKVWHAVDPHAPARRTALGFLPALQNDQCRMTKPWSPSVAAISAVASISRKPTTIAAGMAASAALMKNSHQAEEGNAQVDNDEALAVDHDGFSGCVGRHGSPE